MKEQMKRTVYEAPETRLFRIELEGNFCASAEVKNTVNAAVDDHKVANTFDGTNGDFFASGWEESEN